MPWSICGDGAHEHAQRGHRQIVEDLIRVAKVEPRQPFPGKGQMKLEQLEIEWLRREVQAVVVPAKPAVAGA